VIARVRGRVNWVFGRRRVSPVDAPDPEGAARDAIRHWRRLPDLAGFAELGHGYGDSDGGFGVTYPGDLDGYDRLTLGDRIPAGYVRTYGFWGPPDRYAVLVPEADYLAALAGELAAAGHSAEAARVRALAQQRQGRPPPGPDRAGGK
jgi:hypothetical protein